MAPRQRVRCACGGDLSRPLPRKCPHCGASITGVRVSKWPLIMPVLVIGGCFATLLWYVWRLSLKL
ncbi:MAG: hypothetical protein ABGX05_09175 [Pirellulaceae bacterium]